MRAEALGTPTRARRGWALAPSVRSARSLDPRADPIRRALRPGPRLSRRLSALLKVIFGPESTPWEGGTFKLHITFSEDCPNKAPTVKFISKLFHPNVYADGGICLDILQNNWSPIYDVAAILTSIQSLLCDPNPNSPANGEAARLYSENKREYIRRVQASVESSWAS